MGQIQTERLNIQWPLVEVDPRHVEWLNDRELMKWSEQRHREHDFESQDRYLVDAHTSGSHTVFDITLRPDVPQPMVYQFQANMSIGTMTAYIDRRHRRADLGIMLGPSYHGKGYAREAWEAVALHLATECEIRKIEAGCASGNRPMISLLQRMGYYGEGRRIDHFIIDDKRCDLLLWGRTVG